MKKYQDVQIEAKNASTGSYAAGCPAERSFKSQQQTGYSTPYGVGICQHCEVAR